MKTINLTNDQLEQAIANYALSSGLIEPGMIRIKIGIEGDPVIIKNKLYATLTYYPQQQQENNDE